MPRCLLALAGALVVALAACGESAETAELRERIAELEAQTTTTAAPATTEPPTTTTTTTVPPVTAPAVCPTQPERLPIYDQLHAGELTEAEAMTLTCDYALFDEEYRRRASLLDDGSIGCAALIESANAQTCDTEGLTAAAPATTVPPDCSAEEQTEDDDRIARAIDRGADATDFSPSGAPIGIGTIIWSACDPGRVRTAIEAAFGIDDTDDDAPPPERLTLDRCGDPSGGIITNTAGRTRTAAITVIVTDDAGVRVAEGFDLVRDLAAGAAAEWSTPVFAPDGGAWAGTCTASVEWIG